MLFINSTSITLPFKYVQFVLHLVPRSATREAHVVITMVVVPPLRTVQADSANTYGGATVKSIGAERL